MNTQMLNRLSVTLRSYNVFKDDSQQLIFVLQLLSWLKLSHDERLSSDLTFDVARFAEGPISPSQLENIFKQIRSLPDLGENARAFELEVNSLKRLDQNTLASILDLLWSAYKSEIINFGSIVWEISEHINQRSAFPLLPYDVAKLAVELAEIDPKEYVYCPFMQSFHPALIADAKSNQVFTEDQQVANYPFLLNILCGANLNHKIGHPIYSPSWVEGGKLKEFDVTVAFPPLGLKYKDEPIDLFGRFSGRSLFGEVFHIKHCLAQTKRKAIIAVPQGFLFRTSAGEKDLKSDLVTGGFLEAVIALPGSLLRNTNIPIALIVLNKAHEFRSHFETVFVDASSQNFFSTQLGKNTLQNIDEIVQLVKSRISGQFSEIVSADQCEANSYNLLPNRYVLSQEQKKLQSILESNEVVVLEDIANLIRPQSVRSKDASVEDFYEVMLNDVPGNGYIKTPERTIGVGPKLLRRANQLLLQPHDVLVSVKGTIGRVGIVPESFEGKWLAGQAFQIIRLEPGSQIIDPHVLYMYLKSSVCNDILKSRAAGATVQMIQIRDMKKLPVIVLSREQQLKVLENFQKEIKIQKEIEQLQRQLDAVKDKFWN